MDHNHPSEAVLGTLMFVAGLASVDNSQPGVSFPETASLDNTLPNGYFLGIEKTPPNILFGKAILVSFVFQFVVFYTVWYFTPSLTKNRKGLAWVLTLASAVALLTTTSFEFGYLRTTLWSLLKWEQQGEGAEEATIFTYWVPAFHDWAFQLGNKTSTSVTFSTLSAHLISLESVKRLLLDPQAYKDLAGEYLQWLMTLPIFSLAPLKPTQVSSATAPYYLGGGGRLLFSMENFPRETWFSSVLCGYFIGYCIADLILGHIHYKKVNMLSHFLIAGGLLEVSTLFLATGYMFPELREDFWFPTTFILVRIFFVGFMLHESVFNFSTVKGGNLIYGSALLLHVFWLYKYLQGRKRRMARAKKEKEEATESNKAKETETRANGSVTKPVRNEGTTAKRTNGAVATGSSVVKEEGAFQLRVKNDKPAQV